MVSEQSYESRSYSLVEGFGPIVFEVPPPSVWLSKDTARIAEQRLGRPLVPGDTLELAIPGWPTRRAVLYADGLWYPEASEGDDA